MRLPLDLHVLSTPPAFVLSQDQTLQELISSHDRTAVSRCRERQRVRIIELYRFELGSSGPCRPASYYEFASHIPIPLSIVKQLNLVRRHHSVTASNITRIAARRQVQVEQIQPCRPDRRAPVIRHSQPRVPPQLPQQRELTQNDATLAESRIW